MPASATGNGERQLTERDRGSASKAWSAALVFGVASAGAVFAVLDRTAATACLRSWSRSGPDSRFDCADSELKTLLELESVSDSATATEVRGYLVAWMAFTSIAIGIAAGAAVVGWCMHSPLGMRFRWRQPRTSDLRRARMGVGRVILALSLAGAGLAVGLGQSLSDYDTMHADHLVPIWIALFLISLPTMLAMARSQTIIERLDPDDAGSRARLRAIGARQRSLIMLIGAGILVGFVSLSARWQLVDRLPEGQAIPGSLILLFGGIFGAVAAIVIVPPLNAWLAKVEDVAQSIVDGERHQVGREQGLEEIRRSFEARGSLRIGSLGAATVLTPLVLATIEALAS